MREMRLKYFASDIIIILPIGFELDIVRTYPCLISG